MKIVSLRLPDDLHEALKALAKQESRSLHNLILFILRKYIEALQKQA
jgi:predicted DNA-binding protein